MSSLWFQVPDSSERETGVYSLKRKLSEPKYWPGHVFASPLTEAILEGLMFGSSTPLRLVKEQAYPLKLAAKLHAGTF